jgi:hypothetical protein
MAETPEQRLLSRQHRIYQERAPQLANNLKAFRGGKPYIEAR